MNLQERLSGLKGLVSHSHSKRRFKGDLTVDMISPPMGDFRHTMHVGRGGDVFGDTSFLSNHGRTASRNSEETDSVISPDNKIGAFFSRTLRQIRRGSDNRPLEESKDLSPPPPAISPIIKNAVSLPRLDVDMSNGCPTTRVLFPSSQNTPEEKKSSYGLESGFVTLPRLSRSERQQPSTSGSTNIHRGSLTDPADALLSTCSTSEPKCSTAYSDSLPSLTSLDTFTFDLGPSLMSEVFSLINGHLEEHVLTLDGEEASACGMTREVGSAAFSFMDSLLREDCGSRKSPAAADRQEEEIQPNRDRFSGRVPDVLMGSPERVGMEVERFRSATDVLARHYGVYQGQNGTELQDPELVMVSRPKKKMSYSFLDDEDEVKV